MAPKKKKGKKGKKGKKKAAEGDEEQKNENEELKVSLPKYGWIKITVSEICTLLPDFVFLIYFCKKQLRLCNAPTPQYNWFEVFMLTSQRVMQVHKQIIDHHGRIENVKLFNVDPTNFIKEAKQREQQRILDEKEAEKKRQLARENGEEIEETKESAQAAAEEEKEDAEPEYIQYEDPKTTLFDIFQEYGKETKAEIEEDPNCKKELFYDFTPYNSKDPVLLSLMTAKKY